MANKHVGASLVDARNNLRMEKKFKKTPAGEIPVEWDTAKLSDVCIINPSKSEIPDLLDDVKVSFIPMENVRVEAGGVIALNEREFKEVKNGYTYFKENDVLFAKITPCMENGKVAIVKGLTNGVGFGSTEFHVLRPKNDRLTRNFLYYWISQQSFREIARKHFTGTAGQQRVQKTFFSLVNIPLPSSPEQKKIAEILSSVDEAIEKTGAVIEKTKLLKKGLMQKLLTRGLGHKKFKKTELGEIPSGWEVVKLGELCLGKPEYGANVSALDYKSDLPRYVRITDVNEDGYLSEGDIKSILEDDAQPYLLSDGDFLFARSGATVGKTYLYQKSDGECAFAGYLIRFKPDKEKLLPEFLFQFTHAQQYYNWVNGMLHAGAQPNINATEYSDLLLPVPSVDEQNEILSILSAMDKEISNEKDCKQNLEQTKKSLMQVLLTGKVRVKGG